MSLTVEITSLAYGGAGVGRAEKGGKVVFVPFTAPGDVCVVDVTEEKKNYSNAALVEVKEPSALRVSPRCPVFTRCGGCQWQHMDYPYQVEWKNRIFADVVKRMAGVEHLPLEPPLPSPEPFNWRSRVRLHTDGKRWGFFEARSHMIVDIDECPLLEPQINETLGSLKRCGLPDVVHTVEIALDKRSRKTVVSFHVKERVGFDWSRSLAGAPWIKGYEVFLKEPFKRGRGRIVMREGDTTIWYEAGGATLLAGVDVFSQVNLGQNSRLVEEVLEVAALTGGEEVMDLFCGVGNLTIPMASRARSTVGIDSDRTAVRYARENARLNGVSVEFVAERAGSSKTLEKLTPCVVVLDPPRGGSPEAVKRIARLNPERIVYVSCNPPTLARDVSLLCTSGYSPVYARVVDMFPQTFHIEGIIGLKAV